MDNTAEKVINYEEKANANAESDPTAAVEEKEKSGGFNDYVRIFAYADRLDWTLNGVACLCSIASGATLPLMTLIFGGFTTKFNAFATGATTPSQFRSEVNHYTLWFIYLFIARFTVTYIANVCITFAAMRTTRALRKRFLECTLRQEVWHFDKPSNGSPASQVTTNGNRINQGIAEKLAFVVQALSLFFSSFIIALSVQWKLALITMSIIPVIFFVTGACIAVDAKQEGRILKIYSRAAAMAQEVISSIRTVRAFSAHAKMATKYNEYLQQAHDEGKHKSPNYGVLFSTDYFCVYSGIALAFWKGSRMYQSGEISTVGTVFTVVLAIQIGTTAIQAMAPQFQIMANAISAASELFAIIDKESLLDPLSEEGKRPAECYGDIKIRGLNFAYPARSTAQVLFDLDLDIPARKTTALVGASGCGKSTTVGLLERWYKPTSGQILLDGLDISEYNLKWLRSRVRLVQQEPILFSGTVYDNVANGLIDEQLLLSEEKQSLLIVEACKAANAHDFIEELPNGYHTEVGERAGMLSGGQRQRISIARSIISQPTILLLDEATSALDPRAERVVQDALDRVSQDRTTLIIAHKLATVKNADNIVVMSYGKVMEQGTHEELLDLDGQYAALVRAQDLGGDDEGKPEHVNDEPGPMERRMTLQRTKSEAFSTLTGTEAQKLSAETLNYSLIRCIYIMFAEQKNLYYWFCVSALGALIGGATYPGQALVFSKILHVFTLEGAEARRQADFYSLMFFVIALGNLFAFFAIGWTCNVIGQTVTHRYRLEMFERVINQDMDFFDRPENSSGALTSKLSSLPTSLQELISSNILLICIVIINVISSSILAIAYGWKLGLVVVFGGLPLLLGAGYTRIRLDQKLEQQTGERFAESAGLATEAVTSIRTVASLTLESRFLDQYARNLDGVVTRSSKALIWTMFWFAMSQSLDLLIMALGFWYGSRLLASGEYTATQFYVIFIAVIFGAQAAGQFFGYSTSLTKARPAANYILWLRTLKPLITENETNKDIGPSGDGDIGVKNVDFRYKQRDASRVLRGINMTIKAGSYAACVGPSGCGKSTLISLLERFYDPTSGCITLASTDIKNMSPRRYRSYMSLVQQEPTLYQGSVRENISLGLERQPSDAEILEACRQANALDFISSLPEGLDTPCGNKGLQFSGGQRQRIAIARALIRKPRLLLLDEATSALDTQSERIVQKTLDEAASSRTTIAVAHRLSTIRHADVIFVFANGKVAEMGTHEELQRLKGRYYEMCLAQSLDRA